MERTPVWENWVLVPILVLSSLRDLDNEALCASAEPICEMKGLVLEQWFSHVVP